MISLFNLSKIRFVYKYLCLFTLVFVITLAAKAQGLVEKPGNNPSDTIQAEYPGGYAEMEKFIQTHLHYPGEALDSGIQGMVVLRLKINSKGDISDIKIIRNLGGGCGKEAARMIRMMPRWSPAILKGLPVESERFVPVRFVLK